MPSTYGNNGNRWWVGWNHAQGSFAQFPSLSGPNGYESFPSGSAADDAAIVAAGTGGVVSLHNITWTIAGGPYTSQAQANAAIPAIQAANPAPGALQQVASSAIPGVSQIAGFLSALGQKATWIRVGEVAVGLLLLYAGFKAVVTPEGMKPSDFSLKQAASKVVKVKKV